MAPIARPRVALALTCLALALPGCVASSMWTRAMRSAHVGLAVGDPVAARRALDNALAIAESPPADRQRIAIALGLRAEVEIREERWEAAEADLRRAVALSREGGGQDRVEENLSRLRLALVKTERFSEAEEVQQALGESFDIPRITAFLWDGFRVIPQLESRKHLRAVAEAEFGRELAEAGEFAAALEAFDRAEALGMELHLVNERKSLFVLARARALAGVGRHAEAEALRTEAEAVRSRSDYVESALFDSGSFSIVARWPAEAMPLRVHLARPRSSEVEDIGAALEIAREAARSWEETAGPGTPRFEFVRRPRDADILVDWVHDQSFDGPVGKCQWSASFGDEPLRGARIILISRIMGRYLGEEQLRHVAIHEFGHALGLMGHSGRRDDVMYPSIDVPPLSRPSARDRLTVRRLYEAQLGQSYSR